ncbi:LysR family transcriptional regulator [Phenylobacterium sp.]|uniref:LysR family transcriptional regulator n=1 Tax=Phenylobacterium sp. TaxID=1871053 RepID=UPI00272F2F1A|nr:LysR family transcriptional regulator [Phenylobacterium sp.]MDP1617602.1 LysR family transcriptional regulator [Phenylobacterium sp.]MDP1988310.1 LysR family transcriptional regulator [Phenylobacterium sp.]
MSNPVSWEDQQAFLAVLDEGSLAGAARRLGVSHATARSRITTLETALGAVLFTRSVNGLTPTEQARALEGPARAMAMASAHFIRMAAAAPGEVAGVVRLSVPDFIGVEVIAPMLKALRDAHPAIQIELSLSNAHANLLAQEVDVAVRTVRPTQESLVARRAAVIPIGLFAAEAYLRIRGTPTSLADLEDHDLIGPDRAPADLAFAETLGPAFARERLVLRTDSHPAQLAAARAGLGLAFAQVPVGRRDPRLRHVLPDWTPMALETWIVTHESLRRVPRIRAVMAVLANEFARYHPPG